MERRHRLLGLGNCDGPGEFDCLDTSGTSLPAGVNPIDNTWVGNTGVTAQPAGICS